MPTSPRAPPPPPGIPLLDLQSMASAEDPLECFLGGEPSHPADEAADPLRMGWALLRGEAAHPGPEGAVTWLQPAATAIYGR